MRNIKELLQVMLDNQHCFSFGLCQWARDLYSEDIISYKESDLLKDYIDLHRPSKFSSMDTWNNRKSGWYWPRGKKAPRIKWINKHIKKLKNEKTNRP